MSEPELVEVDQVATTRYAPVEFVGRVERDGWLRIDPTHLREGDWLLARSSPDERWRTGRALVTPGLGVEWHWIPALAEGDYVYRVGKPTTPSLEERIAELERRVSPSVAELDHQDDRDAPRERLVKAHKALRAASARIILLEAALIKACGAITEPALQEEMLEVARAHPLAWQDDPEIDWTGIER